MKLPHLLFASLLTLGILASCLYEYFYNRAQKTRAARHLQGRHRLTPDAFGQRFFPPDQAAIAAEVRQILADHIPIDLSQAHPTDRLCEDLRMDALDSLATTAVVLQLERHFYIQIPNKESQQLYTIQDIVTCVAAKLAAKSHPQ